MSYYIALGIVWTIVRFRMEDVQSHIEYVKKMVAHKNADKFEPAIMPIIVVVTVILWPIDAVLFLMTKR